MDGWIWMNLRQAYAVYECITWYSMGLYHSSLPLPHPIDAYIKMLHFMHASRYFIG
jgi:hypothetical protein